MEAIATLVHHDPYFDVPLSERVAARRDRRDRLFNSPSRKAPEMLDMPLHARPAIVRAKDHIADAKAHRDLGGSPLDPRFTFGNFSIGRSNNLAHAAARQVADGRRGDPVMFNPLYIHSGIGLGKTHLLQAIALSGNSGDRKVLYLTADKFVYSFLAAIKGQTALEFKQVLRGIDVLVIDDLQYLQGKSTQAEFCHTLNTALDSGHQIVVASDRSPRDLDLDDRVRSRLAAGLVVQMSELTEEQRVDILQSRVATATAYHPAFSVPDDVLYFVARTVVSNGRNLEAAVNRLVAHNKLNDQAVTLEMAEPLIRDLIQPNEPKRVRVEDIQRVVARHYGVSKGDILSARRTANVVRPRQVAAYLAKTLTLRSLPDIGRRMGGRDHTTILSSVRKITRLVETEEGLAKTIETLTREILDAH